MKAILALEDGTVFTGESFTGPGEAADEIIFHTTVQIGRASCRERV